MITKLKKHNNHPVKIDYEWVNVHGQPALVCVKCKKWIQWISKRDIYHICGIEAREIQQ